MPLPALLTIQSGINQLRYATLKGIMAAKKKEIKKVAPGAAVASRQKVLALYAPQKQKQTVMIGGSPAEAAKELVKRLARGGAGPMILVIAEKGAGKLNRASWEAIAAAQQLVAAPGGARAGHRRHRRAGPRRGGRRTRRRRGQRRAYRRGRSAGSYTRRTGSSQAMRQVIDQLSPHYVFFPHTYQTRDYVPALAATIDRALVTDVIGVKAGQRRADLRAADVPGQADRGRARPRATAPHLVTIQIGAFRADQVARGASAAEVRPAG